MKHLGRKEIIAFATISEVNGESAALTDRVDRHISECAECAKKLERALKYLDAVSAMSEETFSFYDVTSEYDIPAEKVAAEAKRVFKDGVMYE